MVSCKGAADVNESTLISCLPAARKEIKSGTFRKGGSAGTPRHLEIWYE
jgi:hypothetical protein